MTSLLEPTRMDKALQLITKPETCSSHVDLKVRRPNFGISNPDLFHFTAFVSYLRYNKRRTSIVPAAGLLLVNYLICRFNYV